MRSRYREMRGKLESWYVCDRATDARAEPNCQSIAGPPVDEALGRLVAEKMTPAAVDLALEIRREIEARYDEADQLRSRAVERAQFDADLSQRRFMMVDPANRLVADSLEADWNDKLRQLAKARDDRERGKREDQLLVDNEIRERLIAMTSDFGSLWSDPTTSNRERKRMLAYVVEDVTLVKVPQEGLTKVHVRFRGGQTASMTTKAPRPSWAKVKTPPELVSLVDKLLDDHIYEEIAVILNKRGLRPGGANWPGRDASRFTAKRVQYIVHAYGLTLRFDRLRARGLLTQQELAQRLNIHVQTLIRWAKHGIIRAHAYDGYRWLFEDPGPNPPVKQCSRWNRVADRAEKQGRTAKVKMRIST